ncbi:EF-hand domain-containing protein [Streptomyces netropsis]|uniref:EF-hand domain-containing protein n=1 Tax=Streptomyces netropsis TaxID=55404 RepID=UPI0030D3BBE5
MLDADGDGVISKDEYAARADRVARASGRTEDDPLVVTARTAGDRAWAAMGADGEPVLGALFDLVDADGDAALSLPEFTKLRTALGNPVGNIESAFVALDGDGDGLVGRDDYLASVRAHVSGEDSPVGEALYSIGKVEAADGR